MGTVLGTIFSKLLGSSTLCQSECRNINIQATLDATALATAGAMGLTDISGFCSDGREPSGAALG